VMKDRGNISNMDKCNGVRVGFHHIPKCAGGSVRSILQQKCNVRSIGHHPRQTKGYMSVKSMKDSNIVVFAMTRDPVSRTVSAWNYLYGNARNRLDAEYGRVIRSYGTDINDFITHPDFINDIITEFIHFKPISYYIRYPEDYDYIGQVEHFEESIERMGVISGVNLNCDVHKNAHTNTKTPTTEADLTQNALDVIHSAYADDLKTFRY